MTDRWSGGETENVRNSLINGRIVIWRDGWTNGLTEGVRKDGWTNRWTEGRIFGQKDG